jgi:hypothetical protein
MFQTRIGFFVPVLQFCVPRFRLETGTGTRTEIFEPELEFLNKFFFYIKMNRKLAPGANQQPPVHQFRMRLFKPFWG